MKTLPTLLCLLISGMILFFPITADAIENEECMDCHGDSSLGRTDSTGMQEHVFVEDMKFKYSSHNLNGITCVDCHADITELNFDEDVPHSTALAQVDCADCHEGEAEAYIKSVHQELSGKGIDIQCYACHGYHYITSAAVKSVKERENKSCLKCHDPFTHHNWLPQKATHFDYVQCTVCHAPDAPRHIHLRFYNLVKKEFFETKDIMDALGTDIDGFMPLLSQDGDEVLNVEEFENMVFLLKKRGVHTTFHGELLSEQEPIIHQVSRAAAKRDCNTCHLPNSPFFEEVVLFFADQDGAAYHFKVDRAVLATYSVSNFYAPGGTRIRGLDIIGMALVGATLAGILLHLAARLVTSPRRRKRRAAESIVDDNSQSDIKTDEDQ